MLKEIIILNGLPGSGKTEWINRKQSHLNKKVWSEDIHFCNKQPRNLTVGLCKKILLNDNKSTAILDGLFLTNDIINKLYLSLKKASEKISQFNFNKIKFTIVHFIENRGACLENDAFRKKIGHRKNLSSQTIKASKLSGYYGGETTFQYHFNLYELFKACQKIKNNKKQDKKLIITNNNKNINGKTYKICYMEE